MVSPVRLGPSLKILEVVVIQPTKGDEDLFSNFDDCMDFSSEKNNQFSQELMIDHNVGATENDKNSDIFLGEERGYIRSKVIYDDEIDNCEYDFDLSDEDIKQDSEKSIIHTDSARKENIEVSDKKPQIFLVAENKDDHGLQSTSNDENSIESGIIGNSGNNSSDSYRYPVQYKTFSENLREEHDNVYIKNKSSLGGDAIKEARDPLEDGQGSQVISQTKAPQVGQHTHSLHGESPLRTSVPNRKIPSDRRQSQSEWVSRNFVPGEKPVKDIQTAQNIPQNTRYIPQSDHVNSNPRKRSEDYSQSKNIEIKNKKKKNFFQKMILFMSACLLSILMPFVELYRRFNKRSLMCDTIDDFWKEFQEFAETQSGKGVSFLCYFIWTSVTAFGAIGGWMGVGGAATKTPFDMPSEAISLSCSGADAALSTPKEDSDRKGRFKSLAYIGDCIIQPFYVITSIVGIALTFSGITAASAIITPIILCYVFGFGMAHFLSGISRRCKCPEKIKAIEINIKELEDEIEKEFNKNEKERDNKKIEENNKKIEENKNKILEEKEKYEKAWIPIFSGLSRVVLSTAALVLIFSTGGMGLIIPSLLTTTSLLLYSTLTYFRWSAAKQKTA